MPTMKPQFLLLIGLHVVLVGVSIGQPQPNQPAEFITTGTADVSPALSGLIQTRIRPPSSEHPLAEGELLHIDFDAWRRLEPDRFIPGPLNSLLGAWGLADARDFECLIRHDADRPQLIARWHRRRDPPHTNPSESPIATQDTVGDSGTEFWTLQRRGLAWLVPACVRSWNSVSEPTRRENLAVDRWVRRNLGVLRAIDRASDVLQFVITPSGSLAVLVRMKPATRQLSVMRAIEQMAPPGTTKPEELGPWNRWTLPAVDLSEDIAIQPVVDVGLIGETVAIILAPSSADADSVEESIEH